MDGLKKTPLYDVHMALKGRMVDFGGWALPVQYTSILEEHKAVRTQCGLFDVSHMGEVFVRGAGAFAFLQNLLTNDLTSMQPGRCRYSVMCYPDGGTVDDVLVYKFSDEEYLVVVNASNTDKDFAWMCEHAQPDAELTNESADWAQLALQGPRAQEVLSKIADAAKLPVKNYTFVPEVDVAGIPCIVSRTGYTGEDGFELYCAAKYGPELHAKLMRAGADCGLLPCGLGARDTLRFESSMPLYGHELTQDVTPLEADLGFAVKMNKPDFIGKSALTAPLRKKRIGLKLVDRGIAREHTEVLLSGKPVGVVTSGGPAPTLGGGYAMALVDIAAADATEFELVVRGRGLKAVRVDMPFYKRAK